MDEFNQVIKILSNKEYIQLYQELNVELTDTSVSVLGFISFQRDNNEKARILLVGQLA